MTQAPSIYDIHKSAAIIINNRKLLVERSQGKAVFVAPGGKLEADETPRQCLVRELKEEFQLDIAESDLKNSAHFTPKLQARTTRAKALACLKHMSLVG